MCDKMEMKIVENDPFLRLQMIAKEMFNHHYFFPQISNTQNETNLRNIFLVKTKY